MNVILAVIAIVGVILMFLGIMLMALAGPILSVVGGYCIGLEYGWVAGVAAGLGLFILYQLATRGPDPNASRPVDDL